MVSWPQHAAALALLCMLWVLACNTLAEAGAGDTGAQVVRAPGMAKRIPVLEGGFIYPMLPFGPGNQLVGLREALVLGRLLRRTVVIHQILPLHFKDEAAEGGPGGTRPLDFDQLYDFDRLSRQQSVATQEELLRGGWSGRLDLVGSVGKRFLGADNLERFRRLNVTWGEDTPFVDFHVFNCSNASLGHMEAQMRPYKYAGFALYQTAVPDTGAARFRLKETGHLCHDLYLQVSMTLVRSPHILNIAKRFREQRLGGANAPYLAVHVRPYEDICFDVWTQEPFNSTRADEVCKNGNLYRVFQNQTLVYMRTLERRVKTSGAGRPRLFVMTHPVLRPVVTKLYQQVDLHPVYCDMPDLEAAVGHRSLSLLGVLEEEVASQADFFLGSHVSSMTATVLQDRFARGKSPNSTSVFVDTLSAPVKRKDPREAPRRPRRAPTRSPRKAPRKAPRRAPRNALR
ncbi:hypothetical protein HYH03_015777 [Edaphochlamys debaryana]|uniref:O-fucosyltransferase family protein n=1 Tax=Edaphochlamys debaryana TaxID=47281 RepID=A0A835XL61_9CHLO|nr:hypothetical protein HYH03_015777 [Edaphochlamys debaryana]|eukprot:KAG2485504.1 hypothetical protein HYH03_015777 [Edaphochlamys debaryana]